MWLEWRIEEVHTGFWWGNPRQTDYYEGLSAIEMDLKEIGS
jgi:hypothetical protein